jgi:hypothetical protein
VLIGPGIRVIPWVKTVPVLVLVNCAVALALAGGVSTS